MAFVKYYLNSHEEREAMEYAEKSQNYTSRKHDTSGGRSGVVEHMFLGKCGETAFEKWLIDNNISYKKDDTGYDKADNYDFSINGKTIDVKTSKRFRGEIYIKEFPDDNRKHSISDYYVLVVKEDDGGFTIVGYAPGNWFKEGKCIRKDFGYGMRLCISDNDIKDINAFKNEL